MDSINRYISWKIATGTFAYILEIPNTGSHIGGRISTSSDVWSYMIASAYKLTPEQYKDEFGKMNVEIKERYGTEIPWDDKYLGDVGETGNYILLLAGKDGDQLTNIGIDDLESEVYDHFENMLNAELDKAKVEIQEENKAVQDYIEDSVRKTISDAQNTIDETKKELYEIRTDLETKLSGATEALNKATELFGNGDIKADDIKAVLSSVTEYNEWMEQNSDILLSLKTDYDEATTRLGSIGESEDVTDGLFSRIATSLNAFSGTVGSVESTMNASLGLIENIATWYDENNSSITEAVSFISASGGVISDAVSYVADNDLATELEQKIDAKAGEIVDSILTETNSAITNVTSVMNGLSGVVETTITRMDTISGDLTTMGEAMDAMEGEMEDYMTKINEVSGVAIDLRDRWSAESGKLSTVANLTAETDENGDIIYYVSGATGDEIRVSKTPSGEWVDEYGTTYAEERVYTHWSQAIGSYIQQQASSITMSVMNSSGLTAAIKLAIERGEKGEDESVIKMISDKLIITGEMIAEAISASTANIGGIIIGNGEIKSQANSNGEPMFKLNGKDGMFYAENAEIRGKITATELVLKNGQTAEDYISGQTSALNNSLTQYLESPEFKTTITEGYVSESSFNEWASKQNNFTGEELSALSESIVNAEISFSKDPRQDEYGRTIYTAKIGDNEYEWTTIEGDNFVALGHTYSNGDKQNFIVSKEGLLTANNAWIQGKIYASEGVFQGRVEASEGFFHGAVSATSLHIGDKTAENYIQEYVNDGNTSALDDMAKNLGYSNFADMQSKASSGNTIISGGMINTNLITADEAFIQNLVSNNAFIDNLKVTKLDTKPTGTSKVRVEENYVKVIDEEGRTRCQISDFSMFDVTERTAFIDGTLTDNPFTLPSFTIPKGNGSIDRYEYPLTTYNIGLMGEGDKLNLDKCWFFFNISLQNERLTNGEEIILTSYGPIVDLYCDGEKIVFSNNDGHLGYGNEVDGRLIGADQTEYDTLSGTVGNLVTSIMSYTVGKEKIREGGELRNGGPGFYSLVITMDFSVIYNISSELSLYVDNNGSLAEQNGLKITVTKDEKNKNSTFILKDGLISLNSKGGLVVSDDCICMKIGKFGLSISENGIKYTKTANTNGGTWISLIN